jgi:hypothetical protein
LKTGRRADELAAWFRDARDPDRLAEEMRALLDGHGRASATEDAQIIDYLRRRAR